MRSRTASSTSRMSSVASALLLCVPPWRGDTVVHVSSDSHAHARPSQELDKEDGDVGKGRATSSPLCRHPLRSSLLSRTSRVSTGSSNLSDFGYSLSRLECLISKCRISIQSTSVPRSNPSGDRLVPGRRKTFGGQTADFEKQCAPKWLSTKNRSTALHPDILSPWRHLLILPIPCHVHCARARLTYAENLVSGVLLGACEGVCARAVPACGVRKSGVGARRESGQRHRCGEAVPGAAGGRRTLVWSPFQWHGHVRTVCGRTYGGLDDAVSSGSAGSVMRGRLGWCGVR